jgi:DNA-binding beta-propeller fold protein YncE
MDGSGNLYVTEFNNDTIRVLTPGAVVTTLAGVAGAGTTNLETVPQVLSDPFGIAVDPTTGHLLITLDDAILRLAIR